MSVDVNPPQVAADRYTRRLPIGAEIVDGGACFRVWAPRRNRVAVVFEGEEAPAETALERNAGGYFAGFVGGAAALMRYRLRLDDDERLYPDPASRFQPEGPFGPSQLIDPRSFTWRDDDWPGIQLQGQVCYELHLGTFTPEGTWEAASGQLGELAKIGVTLVEIMPVSDFPGKFGWGYDGVNLFAPSRLYGEPDAMRAFIDQAHRLGIGVILDAVYNHVGTVGDFLSEFSADYYTTKYANEWGAALNFECPGGAGTREFVTTNARYWIEEFHLDGFRLDATQSIHDETSPHIIAEMAAAARAAAGARAIVFIAENEPQHAHLVRPADADGYALDALWNDDFHHTAVVRLTSHNEAYYTDYTGSAEELLSAVKWGFLYQGQRYKWQGKRRGTPTFGLSGAAFVNFLENHDQVANSGRGSRIHQLTSPGKFRAMTALMLLTPGTPLLFQGQEFSSSRPFLYFSDHEPHHAGEILAGRAKFLSQFPSLATPAMQQRLLDPDDVQTFIHCKLDFSERERNAWSYELHKDLLALRRRDPVIAAQDATQLHGGTMGADALHLRYVHELGSDRLLVVNFGRDLHLNPCPHPLMAPPLGCRWKLLWSSEDPKYGGNGTPEPESEHGWLVMGESAILLCPEPDE
jgi:maltooligosyltrehalose trehalohydrolase